MATGVYKRIKSVWNKGLKLGSRGYHHSEETKRKISQAHIGKIQDSPSIETRQKISKALKGKKKPPRSAEHSRKLGLIHKGKKHSIERRKRMADMQRGKKCHFWRGGLTKKHYKIRNSLEYHLWRESVLERDNYKCIWCGSMENLHADHIKPFFLYPELRFAIDNGRTLCKECHKKTDTYFTRWFNYDKTTKKFIKS